MIEISETALNVLFEGLRASCVERERGLRLKEEGRLTLELDTPKKQDRVISHGNQVVLIIDPVFEARVGHAIIDVENTAGGSELIMRSFERPRNIK